MPINQVVENAIQQTGLFARALLVGGLALALALLPLPVALLLVTGGGGLVLALISPIWAVFAAVLAVPFQELVRLPGGLSVVQAALLLVLASWSLHTLAHCDRPIHTGRVFPGLIALLWALMLSSALTPYSQTAALTETLRWFTVVLVYLVTLNTLSEPRHQRLRLLGLLGCLLVAPAANGLYGLLQFITGDGPPSFAIAGGFVRAYGTIGQPNSFAGYMNMAWPLAVALALGAAWQLGQRYWLRHQPTTTAEEPREPLSLLLLVLIVAGGAAAILLGALVASFSRGGWVGAAGGGGAMLLVLLLLQPQFRRRIGHGLALIVLGSGLLLFIGVSGLLPTSVTQRVESIATNLRLFDVRTVEANPANFAVVERMAQLQAAWAMFTDYPLTGVGPGNYTIAYEGLEGFAVQPYLFEPWYTSRGHAHNYYLHMAAEAGLVGLLVYLGLLVLLGIQTYHALRVAPDWLWRSIVFGGCGIIVSVATHNLFENLHVLNMGVQLGAVWGLLAATETISRSKKGP